VFFSLTAQHHSKVKVFPGSINPPRSGPTKDTLCIFPITGYWPKKENRAKEDSGERADEKHSTWAGSGSFPPHRWQRLGIHNVLYSKAA